MLIVSMLVWWYGRGWLGMARSSIRRVANLNRFFSAGTLLRTLFSPWKQLISASGPGSSLDAVFRAAVDNIISRFVGFWVRLGTLLVSLSASLLVGLTGLTMVVLWPALPIAAVVLIAYGIGGWL